MKRLIFLPILSILFLSFTVSAQEELDKEEGTLKKFVEIFTIHPNKKAAAADSSLYPSKIILAPIINYSPETSWGFGVGAKYLFKMRGSGDETRTSNMPLSAMYTLENQFILFSGFEIFTNREEWMIYGNFIYQDFPRLYYGIGRNTPTENEEHFNFNQVLFEPLLLKRIFTKHLFIGGGIRYNRVYNVKPKENGILDEQIFPGSSGATNIGLELAAVYDSRDNILNATKGWFMELTHGIYGKSLGGEHRFNLTRLDLKHYIKPFKNDDVLAFQFKAHISHGDVPFNELALFGSQEIMRGYYEGRFIERHLLAAQVEYRKKLIGRLGGVVFIGFGDVANRFHDFSIKNLRFSAGLGLRFLLEKRERLNIRLDWGFGKKTNNYYLNIAEAF
ncbi:BamA/TamA family outer membrane protein [Microscilla marina]|uniref:Outer membrane protein, OMP85 family n=1 Tax=Microscilla marina ATCC 23134 TaxID=313606 RepID=A1ZP84_MICM2|nr:BamA/TamA family outer membrane protein [Microscilla marina]EAY27876.1 outer membrane protein, OMP85 family [Microscilla marina ATCC 23134]